MNVLIADFDLFAKVGGGQTFYRAVIEKNPQLTFSYLAIDEPADAPRPANARPIAYREDYRADAWADFDDYTPPRWCLDAFLRASNIARSVAGREFDVVDLPDYEQFGMFLRPALSHHGVRAGKIVLSLHGRLSTSVRNNWLTEGFVDHALTTQEEMQYRAVDLRYGISRSYLDEWRGQVELPNHYFSPLRFIDLTEPRLAPSANGPPDLCFVGRTEKCKGPDVFVELAWWLPRELYGRAVLIGPESGTLDGLGSNHYLRQFVQRRQMHEVVDFRGPMNAAAVRQVFASRTVAVLPSRYDTFNLAAAEALFSGCPTAIGSGAGICRFLRDVAPDVPYIEIPMDHPQSCLPQLVEVLREYGAYRGRLVDALRRARLTATGPELEEIYRTGGLFDAAARQELARWYERLMGVGEQRPGVGGNEPDVKSHGLCRERTPCRSVRGESASIRSSRNATEGVPDRAAAEPLPDNDEVAARWKAHAKRAVRAMTTPGMRRRLRALDPRGTLRQQKPQAAPQQRDALLVRAQALHHLPERTDADVEHKLTACAALLAESKLDRVRLWREMGRLESLRGNEL
ncbi:MAG TPA: glycosyltransferase, partial [Pirellulales bacterium]|nr:glycosyltransferase [Pirellulales bacterium]